MDVIPVTMPQTPVSIPKSVQWINPTVLQNHTEVVVQKNSAKGIIDSMSRTKNCILRVKNGSAFLISPSMGLDYIKSLGVAWNCGYDDFVEEYKKAFENIVGQTIEAKNDRKDFVLFELKNRPEEAGKYEEYIKKEYLSIYKHLLESGNIADFGLVVRTGFLTKSKLEKIIDLAKANGSVELTAVVMDEMNKLKKPKKFVL